LIVFTRGEIHTQLTRSIAAKVAAILLPIEFIYLFRGGRTGKLRMEEPAIAGKGAASCVDRCYCVLRQCFAELLHFLNQT
jgi:hypothetical protein